MSNKYCESCGSKIPDGAKFCPECGKQVSYFKEDDIIDVTPIEKNDPQKRSLPYKKIVKSDEKESTTSIKKSKGGLFFLLFALIVFLLMFLSDLPYMHNSLKNNTNAIQIVSVSSTYNRDSLRVDFKNNTNKNITNISFKVFYVGGLADDTNTTTFYYHGLVLPGQRFTAIDKNFESYNYCQRIYFDKIYITYANGSLEEINKDQNWYLQ